MSGRIFDTEFLKKLDTIAINVRVLMSEGGGGNRKSRSKGSSVEFSDFREYTTGDDFRRIDWNAYGRFDKLFVKLFMEEQEAMINVFVDSSKSMDFGNPKKSEVSLKLAGVLAFLALNNLDRVCINSLSKDFFKQSTAVTGRSMFDSCIAFLEGISFSGETDINAAIKKKDVKSRGMSVIISDFFSPNGIEEAIKYLLYKKQDVFLIHVLSPEELNPELEGQVRLVDSETGKVMDVAVTPALLKQYHIKLNEFNNNIKEFCCKMGVSYIQVSSADSIEKIIFEQFTGAGVIR
ncbi:MAG: hypothetical protein A2Y23_14590 [Clostridiales bacterium GWB2_37_7]|nr:MAG: hypothetical protein A2Y23_14590 [Clostridiales bacterium GWB2_37_7]